MLLSAMIVQRQTQIDGLSESIAELDSDNRSLMFDIAQLESTKRIMRIALAEPGEEFETVNGLGMIIPEITIYLDPLSNESLQGWQRVDGRIKARTELAAAYPIDLCHKLAELADDACCADSAA